MPPWLLKRGFPAGTPDRFPPCHETVRGPYHASGRQRIKIQCAGRLGGAEIARTESYRDGSIPLHTLRANIDYGTAEAHTTYGRIGIKVWIYKGEVLPTKAVKKEAPEAQEGGAK